MKGILIRINICAAASPTIAMLMLATILSLVSVAMVSIPHQASAKVCISTSSSHNDKNNDDADTTCNDQQNSNNDDDHSTAKDKTPFRLALPFP
jgi:hypothetical protein